jgi:uncharacterized protein YaaR (DUF327 family)
VASNSRNPKGHPTIKNANTSLNELTEEVLKNEEKELE